MRPSRELDTFSFSFVKSAFGACVGLVLFVSQVAPQVAYGAPQKIQVRPFRVELERKSVTQRVFLLKVKQGTNPGVNHIVLFRSVSNNANAFAVRVLRTYEGGTFAGTRVRSYQNLSEVTPGKEYIAIEKAGSVEEALGALPVAPEPQVLQEPQEQKIEPQQVQTENVTGLEEVEAGLNLIPDVLDYDPELDAGNSPIELDREAPAPRLTVDEPQIFDDDLNGINLAFGMIRSLTPSGGSTFFGAGGIRYGYTLNRNLFFFSPKLQDSLTLEFGVFLLKVNGFDPPSATVLDSFTVLPLAATLRYNAHFSLDWSGYIYIGLMKYMIVDATNFTSTGTTMLSAFMPSVGVGLIYRLGPRWYLRTNLGLDTIDVGFTLRF